MYILQDFPIQIEKFLTRSYPFARIAELQVIELFTGSENCLPLAQ